MDKQTLNSKQLFDEAKHVLVGGVNSPVRAFKSVGDYPLFISKGKGASIYTEDHKSYIDYVLSWGPLILGHAHHDVISAIQKTAELGTSFGAPTSLETSLATKIQRDYPHMEKIRFVNSGTEASMSAIRLARGVTGKSKLLKFNGCYHGHSDSLLVATGSGGLTFGRPDSAGVLPEVAAQTIVLEYNDAEGVRSLFKECGHDISSIILEPICGNMGVILPTASFLSALKDMCSLYGALLIFDEVMCGYRTSQLSASAFFGITPDITILGKVIGGGLPCGAYGGRDEIMMQLSPEGPVYQAGTLSGNPLVMAAGIATLDYIHDMNVISILSERCQWLVDDVQSWIKQKGLAISLVSSGSMFSLFFSENSPRNLNDVKRSHTERFPLFHQAMLEEGIYLAPSAFEANFLSICHDELILEKTSNAIKKCLFL